MKRLVVMLMCAGVAASVQAEIGPAPTISMLARGAGRIVVARVLDSNRGLRPMHSAIS